MRPAGIRPASAGTALQRQLEERISEQLFERMNLQMEKRLAVLERELKTSGPEMGHRRILTTLGEATASMLSRGELTHEMAEAAVSRITVYRDAVVVELKY
jgi:hypothetical protein